MRKTITAILSAMLVLCGLTGCGTGENGAPAADNGKVKIVATIFPEYDWVRNIAGDNADVTLLLDNGADLHSFQPTAEDVLKISDCDIFVYVGGESDEWAEQALEQAVNKDMQVIDLMDVMGESAKEEEIKEGMQAEPEEEEGGEEAPEYDEHVWLSVKNARLFCARITEVLCEKDPQNAQTYRENLAAYDEKLAALDGKFTALTEKAAGRTLIFGDRFPFRYLTDDYGLEYYAAFVGCSAETEASFETIAFLAGKADELGSKRIYTIDGSDQKIAKAVINSTKTKDMQIAVLDSMQSVTGVQAENGTDYLSVMQKNYEVLKEDLE